MTPEQELNEDAVRTLASPKVFDRGREYYLQGRVLDLILRGDQLHADVQGSEPVPYHVVFTSREGRVSQASCTCPYELGGLCKHAVAALLAYFQEPDRVERRPSLEGLLAPLGRDQLQSILLELAVSDPDLTERIELLAARSAVGAPSAEAAPRELPAVDGARVRLALRASLRATGLGRYDDYGSVGPAVDVLQATAEQSRPYLEVGDSRSALVYLEAVADYATEHVEELLGHEGLEIDALCEELGKLLAEAFLVTEFPPSERQEWAEKVAVWERRARDYGYEGPFQVARCAAQQGWDYLPLQRVLRGEITESGAWEGEPPPCADDLAKIRLEILGRQGRWEEYLNLAEGEGQTDRYLAALVRLGRIAEAVEYGRVYLTTRREVLTFSTVLEAAGAGKEALQVAEDALSRLPAEPYSGGDLPRWTRDLAARLGEPDRALQAAQLVMQERPTLADYLAVEKLAGERWPGLRNELLQYVKESKSHYPSDQIDIFLHEGLIDDAIAAVDASPGHELVERVADAVLATHPDWVFHASTHQFDRIADAGKSQYYASAIQWLKRAKDALHAAGRGAEWREYLEGVIARHHRKYSLRPGLERLR